MPNKSKNRWLDVQILIASLAVTSTVALWNGFARAASVAASPTDTSTPDPTSTQISPPPSATPYPTATAIATAVATVDPNATIHLPKVHLLLGGQLPVVQVVVAQPQPSNSKTNNPVASTGSKAPGKSSPPPVAKTSSSKP
jgi:hypothetical protein